MGASDEWANAGIGMHFRCKHKRKPLLASVSRDLEEKYPAEYEPTRIVPLMRPDSILPQLLFQYFSMLA